MTDTSGGSPASVVDDSVSLVPHDTADHKPFPFYDLPPELRNMLVDYFQPSLLRISKQFRHEYEKEVFKSAAISSLIQPFRVGNELYWQNMALPQALTNVRLRLNYNHYLRLRWIHKRFEECVNVFPSVVNILLRIDLFVYRYDDLIDENYITTEDLFRLPPIDGGRVKIEFVLFLHSRLFNVLKSCQNSDGEADCVSWDTPMVVFRASPSAGSYTYKGLHLEVESIGIFDESLDLCGLGVKDEEDRENSLYRL
ncbi:hypothetical protein D0864_05319 [Hortaea werneckii]|uniref:F-box domain-containing protein n=1 Tax=Hortaea werneckii TaxID=91943 RepID=A0A3M7G2Q6_HORWE|nr:hypothetical protein D0864_05319 [Hortaea werneckii]